MKEGTKPPETTISQGVLNPISIAVLVLLIGLIVLLLFKDELLSHENFIPWFIAIIGVILAILMAASIKIADQWEKAVILRMGKFIGLKGPGLFLIIPIIDRVDTYIDQRVRVTDFNAEKTLALVGKGVTFDSGGLNIKTGGGMATMKSDMSGAAVVAATMVTLARLKTKSHVIGAIPIVENMLSGKATRPGDIVRSHAGKTIEIGNTDAEGRLILIDAMSYVVKKYKPQTLIDLATLTGACVVALGEKIAGVFAPDDDLAKRIITSGQKTHERCWQMPLPDDYKELLKSDFADLNNMPSSRWGGAITAALFLSEFNGDTRWAHIDIAGPAYNKKGDSYCGPGGTGFGVRLLCHLVETKGF